MTSPRGAVSTTTLDHLKQAVLEAGLEIYRANGQEIRIAERVRMHLMDSGVSVRMAAEPEISLTIRSQRSDFPTTPADDLFNKVRGAVGPSVQGHGFRETRAVTREITDPVDEASVLDVWHELTFTKQPRNLDTLIADLRWALSVPKCVTE